MHRRLNPSWRFLAVFLVLACPVLALGQALADRVPADAIIYVGWRGVQSLGPGYPNSNLKAVVDQTQVNQFIDEFLPKLADRLAQEDPNAAQALSVFRAVAGPMWRHPSAFFFAGIDFNNPNMPVPHLGLISQAGNESAALQQQVEGLLQKAGGQPPFPVRVVKVGDLVALMVGYDRPEAALAGGAGGAKVLSADPTFVQALGQVGKDAVSTGYVNIEAVVNLADRIVQMAGPPEVQQLVPKVETALGIRGLRRLIFTQGFEGKEWGTRVFVAVPQPRQGFLANLDNVKPLSNDIYTAIPQNVRLAGASHFDFAAFISALQSAAGQLDPNIGPMVDNIFQQVDQAVGVDVRKDLLGSLGNEWAYYSDTEVMGRSLLGITVVNRLKDPTKAEQSITKVEQFITNTISQQIPDKKATLAVRETKSGNVTIHYLAIPLVAPAWAIANGNLYIGLYPQVVGAAAAHGATKGTSILDNKDFVALREKLGGSKASAIAFADLPRLAPDSYGTWVAVSRLSGIGDILGVPAPAMLLPTLDKIMPYLSPAGQASWVDGEGIHIHAISPFPGSELLASDPTAMGPAQPALIMSIVLPALNKAKEQANRVKGANSSPKR